MDNLFALVSILPMVFAGFTVFISLITVWDALRTIRAKHRISYLLNSDAAHDLKLQADLAEVRLMVRGTNTLDATTRQSLVEIIETEAKKLPAADQALIGRGLHQESRRGADRFLKEIAV